MTEEYPDTLIGIELTKEGKIPEKDYDLVTDEDISEVLADSARSAIIGILRHGIEDKMTSEQINDSTNERVIREKIVKRHALSVTEISRMSKDPELSDAPLSNSQIYHHLPILIDAGYVIKYGVVKKGGRKTDYYRRTAKIFMFEKFPGSDDHRSERANQKVEQMFKFFGFNLPEKLVKEFIELRMKAADIEHEAHSKLMRMVRKDVADAEVLYMFEDLICTHSIASDEWIKIRKRMNEILFEN
jgi:DNA-binding transcriptional ArsR family regulator